MVYVLRIHKGGAVLVRDRAGVELAVCAKGFYLARGLYVEDVDGNG
jgi:hypothetical protein